MFCTNCGAKLPEGSKFCMECGTKIAHLEEPAPSTTSWNEPLETVEEETVERSRPMVSFDWSNVKEESHKKEVPEVHSPWGTTGLSDKELFADLANPSEDHSRTMSFIDILKKERDAKAKAAEEDARPFTEREEPAGDFSAFEEAPSFYVPPLYEDTEGHTVTPFEELVINDEDVPFEESLDMELSYDDTDSDIKMPSFISEMEDYEEEVEAEPEKFHTASFEEPEFDPSLDQTDDFTDLESSLAAILEAGAGKSTVEETPVDLFEGVSEDTSIEDMYLDVEEEPVTEEVTEAYEAAPLEKVVEEAEESEEPEITFENDSNEELFDDFVPKHASLDVEEITVDNEEDLDEEELENLEDLYISDVDFNDEPNDESDEEAGLEDKELEVVVPEIEPEESVSPESEIEALKRRLAELMGEPEAPEEIAKEEPATVEELFEVELPNEETDEEPEEESLEVELRDEEVEDEEEIEVEPETEPEVVETKKSDAVSIEELERDLFGDIDGEEVEPEATKKIDKFYTLYKKNEEFQKLLDEEYNKLQSEDKVPHVEDYVPVEVVKDEPVMATPVVEKAEVKETEPTPAVEKKVVPEKITTVANKETSIQETEDEEPSGGALTVLAVVVAVLLVILLAIILVLNFAPDSGIAMSIDSVIETITSMFSDAGTTNGLLLM